MNTRGAAAEEQAAEFLRKKGFKILARNYLARGGELDIVAREGKTLVFVEVKSRASEAFGGAVAAVTPAKQKRVVAAAVQYIKENRPAYDSIRFDVICIRAEQVEHLAQAFCPARLTL